MTTNPPTGDGHTNEQSNSNADQAPGQNKTSAVIINGRPREVSGQSISYSQIVQLAFPNDQANESTVYTVAYANPHGKDGTLVFGQEIHVKEGMIFNVTKTNRS
jgi:multiubiquitin